MLRNWSFGYYVQDLTEMQVPLIAGSKLSLSIAGAKVEPEPTTDRFVDIMLQVDKAESCKYKVSLASQQFVACHQQQGRARQK
uniref:Uncharacterized protein n=1 Tax=Oryza glumipatula TaxID=40148 RepID=A0A0D9YTF1_9ORYZ